MMPMHVLVGGLAGSQLAPKGWMSTLPITTVIVGTALGTFPAAWLMERVGRKLGLIIGALLGAIVLALAALSIHLSAFYFFCFCTLLMGFTIAIAQQMRFAAIEFAGIDNAAQAVSVMMLGGVLAAYIGPEIGSLASNQEVLSWWARAFNGASDLIAHDRNNRLILEVNYSISYLVMSLVLFLAIVLAFFLIPSTPALSQNTKEQAHKSADPDAFWLAVICSVTAFGVMSYVMTATPISMHHHYSYSLDDAKQVIQWHILAMFLPSLLTGSVIAKIGNQWSIFFGLLTFVISLAIAISGQSHAHFAASLIALGIAWNILFTTGTTLLSQAGANQSQQASHDFFVFSSQAIATLIAGVTLLRFGWQGVLWGSLLAIIPCSIWVLRNRQLSGQS